MTLSGLSKPFNVNNISPDSESIFTMYLFYLIVFTLVKSQAHVTQKRTFLVKVHNSFLGILADFFRGCFFS